jgi:DNA polymerase III subunit epsilon
MKTVVIDTETTGLSHRWHQPLTVGMLFVDVEKDFEKILNAKHILIRHENYHIDPAAMAINGIDLDEHDKTAVEPAKACKQINSFMKKSEGFLLGHNLSFDLRFLDELFRREEVESNFPDEKVDTMILWNELKRRQIVPSNLRSNLQTLAEFFKVDYSNAHSALGDCEITMKVFQKMID